MRAPVLYRALPLFASIHDASPKAISRRTSYLRVRLAFHLYPQVIQALCSVRWFGPSLPITVASACPWIGHPVSGLILCTYFALFRLAFTMAPSNDLTLHIKLTRWIVLQKARRHRINLLRLLVGTQFQDLFHSPPGVLFTFPSLYLFTIDRILYLALAGGPAGFKQGFSCPVLLE